MKYTTTNLIYILQEDYKQRAVLDEEVEDFVITADTLLIDWRENCNLLEWEKLSLYFNRCFDINIPWQVWKERVFPENEKTLKDLGILISIYAEKPECKPVRLLGQECLSAGIFRMLMSRLASRGVIITGISPSVEIGEWLMTNAGDLMQEMCLIAPGILPQVKINENKLVRYGPSVIGIGIIVLIFSWLMSVSFLAFSGFMIALSGFIMLQVGGRMEPASVEFEGIKNFRDIIERILQNERK